jgi:phosphoribosylamine---glycine ligase
LDGDEVSMHAACDIRDYAVFPSSQDHKRVLDGDKGEMTGGMGTIAPVPWFNMDAVERSAIAVIDPALAALQRDNRNYQGVLYPGLIVERSGNIKVIEYNARFGDPEAQVYLRLMKTDLIEMIISTLNHTLGDKPLEWHDGYAVNVVLASQGYPFETVTGKPIDIGKLPDGVELYHGGTTLIGNRLYTSGGRVLGVSAVGSTLEQARDLAYSAVDSIHFEGMHYRRDIGLRPRLSKSIRIPKSMNLSSRNS